MHSSLHVHFYTRIRRTRAKNNGQLFKTNHRFSQTDVLTKAVLEFRGDSLKSVVITSFKIRAWIS